MEARENLQDDDPVVTAIEAVAKRHNLSIDFRVQRKSWGVLFLETRGLKFDAACVVLRKAHTELIASGVMGASLSYYEALHPRAGNPVIEVQNVWWQQ